MGSNLEHKPLKYFLAEKPRNGLYKGKEYQGSGNRWIKMNEVFSLNFISNDETSEKLKVTDSEIERFSCKSGDLLFGRTSLTLEGVGDCLLVQDITDDPIFESNLFRIRFDTTKAYPLFFYYFFKSHYGRQIIQRIAKQTAATSITATDLIEEDVPNFSFDEQVIIADLIYQFDRKASLNSQTNQTLEQMAQVLFKSWFVDFDPVIDNGLAAGINVTDFPEALQQKAEQRKQAQQLPDFNPLPDDILNLFPSEFEQSEEFSIGINGWIPKGWINGTFEDVANGLSGYAFKGKDFIEVGCAVIKIKNISTDRTVNTSEVNRISSEVAAGAKRFLLDDGDILVAMTGAGSVGKFGMFAKENDESHYLNQRICKLSPKLKKGIPFLFAALSRPGVEKNIFKAAQGSGQPNISVKGILATKLLVPNENTIELFNSLLIQVFERKIALKKDSFSLSKLRDTVLPKLISGEITINKEVA